MGWLRSKGGDGVAKVGDGVAKGGDMVAKGGDGVAKGELVSKGEESLKS